jgi:hypothetical protein
MVRVIIRRVVSGTAAEKMNQNAWLPRAIGTDTRQFLIRVAGRLGGPSGASAPWFGPRSGDFGNDAAVPHAIIAKRLSFPLHPWFGICGQPHNFFRCGRTVALIRHCTAYPFGYNVANPSGQGLRWPSVAEAHQVECHLPCCGGRLCGTGRVWSWKGKPRLQIAEDTFGELTLSGGASSLPAGYTLTHRSATW